MQRSLWPNIRSERLVDLVRDWAQQHGLQPLIVFDGPAPLEADDVVGTGGEIADDWIAREARAHQPYWLVTSDRGLRERVGGDAERVIGGGRFARELTR